MSELTDWVWLVVAVIWVVAQVLPRLFRKQRKGSPAAPTRKAATSLPQADRRPEPAGPHATFGPPRLDAQTRERIGSAEPINPR